MASAAFLREHLGWEIEGAPALTDVEVSRGLKRGAEHENPPAEIFRVDELVDDTDGAGDAETAVDVTFSNKLNASALDFSDDANDPAWCN